MAEAAPFKDLIDADAVARIAAGISAVHPAFPAERFVACADGLGPLALKARVAHVAAALRASLPAPWAEAVAVLLASLPPALPDETAVSSGFWLWPLLQVVEDHAADPQLSLPALRELTRRFSAEFAVRPYLARHPEAAWPAVHGWAADPDVHVRRLASEGTRPRLPWGLRLRHDPRLGLGVLDRLVDDPSAYVRRSVANHLGDVAKDDPALALATATRWLAEDPRRTPLVRHGLRGPLKAGHPGALALLGVGGAVTVADLRCPPTAAIGDRLRLTARITASEDANVRADVVWSWPGARSGAWSSRTFVGGQRALSAGASWDFAFDLSLRPVTTRPLRTGLQRLTLRVNGTDVGEVGFELA